MPMPGPLSSARAPRKAFLSACMWQGMRALTARLLAARWQRPHDARHLISSLSAASWLLKRRSPRLKLSARLSRTGHTSTRL